MAEFDDESENESGSSLRKQLEASLKQNKVLAKELGGFKAKQLIADKGFAYVKAEDLADVDLNELEAKATEINERKENDRKAVLRELFTEQGTPPDELDDTIAQFLAPKQESPEEVGSRIADLGRIQGRAVDRSAEGLSGHDLILAALA